MQKRFFTIAAVLFAGAVYCGQFEDISGNENVRHDLRKNFHVNFTRDDKAGKNLYKRQLMEFATSPVQVPLKWYFAGVAPREYVVELSPDKEFRDVRKITTHVNMVNADNLLLSTTYYWRVSCVVNGRKIVSDTFSFQTADTPPRWIRVPGAGNFRDIGNWQVPGGRIKQGMVYRGTRIDREPWKATEEGLDILIKDLKIKTELDLCGPAKNPFILKKYGVNVIAEAYQAYMIGLKKASMRKKTVELLKKFADKDFYPVYVHCDGGADRTGILIFFLEAILGVSEHDLLLDYEYTTFFGHRNRNSKEMKPFLDMLNTKPGKNLTEKAVTFLKEEGMTEEDMNKIRNELIVKQK